MLNFVRLKYGYYASLIREYRGVRRSLVGRERSGGWCGGREKYDDGLWLGWRRRRRIFRVALMKIRQ